MEVDKRSEWLDLERYESLFSMQWCGVDAGVGRTESVGHFHSMLRSKTLTPEPLAVADKNLFTLDDALCSFTAFASA